jgi:hypothetical protein
MVLIVNATFLTRIIKKIIRKSFMHTKSTGVSKVFRILLLALAMFFSLLNSAYAKDDAAIKKAFLDFDTIQFGDTIAAPWRIVQAKTWKEAKTTQKVIAEGMSSDASVVKLSLKQREDLYKAWQKSPDDIWVWYFPQPEHLELIAEEGKYFIKLVMSRSDAEVAQIDADNKAYIEGEKPLNPAVYTQAGFDAKPFSREYADWQKRFSKDIEAFEANMRKDREYGKNIVTDKNPDGLKKSFANSIDTGLKGLSMRTELISAYYAAPGHEGTEVTPGGMVFTQFTLAKEAKPVGFGGAFNDENKQVELWYMTFADLKKFTVSEFKESIVFEAFKKEIPAESAAAAADPMTEQPKKYSQAELPPYKTVKRNSWPALVFIRGADGKIKLYGMSMEMARIMGNIYNKQLF